MILGSRSRSSNEAKWMLWKLISSLKALFHFSRALADIHVFLSDTRVKFGGKTDGSSIGPKCFQSKRRAVKDRGKVCKNWLAMWRDIAGSVVSVVSCGKSCTSRLKRLGGKDEKPNLGVTLIDRCCRLVGSRFSSEGVCSSEKFVSLRDTSVLGSICRMLRLI